MLNKKLWKKKQKKAAAKQKRSEQKLAEAAQREITDKLKAEKAEKKAAQAQERIKELFPNLFANQDASARAQDPQATVQQQQAATATPTAQSEADRLAAQQKAEGAKREREIAKQKASAKSKAAYERRKAETEAKKANRPYVFSTEDLLPTIQEEALKKEKERAAKKQQRLQQKLAEEIKLQDGSRHKAEKDDSKRAAQEKRAAELYAQTKENKATAIGSDVRNEAKAIGKAVITTKVVREAVGSNNPLQAAEALETGIRESAKLVSNEAVKKELDTMADRLKDTSNSLKAKNTDSKTRWQAIKDWCSSAVSSCSEMLSRIPDLGINSTARKVMQGLTSCFTSAANDIDTRAQHQGKSSNQSKKEVMNPMHENRLSSKRRSSKLPQQNTERGM